MTSQYPPLGRPVAATLSLAGAAVAIAAPAAHAEVVATPTNLFMNAFDPGQMGAASEDAFLDVDGDGVSDFQITHRTNSQPVPVLKVDVNGELTLTKGATDLFVAIVEDAGDGLGDPDGSYAEALTIGDTVGPASTLIDLASAGYDPRLLDEDDTDATGETGGAFSIVHGEIAPGGPRIGPLYVGFVIGSGDDQHFGYLEFIQVANDELESNNVDNLATARLSGFAIETTANTPIVIAPINVPEPATAAAAFAGAGALLLRRRRGHV